MKRGKGHHISGRRIYRFVLAERVAHWVNAGAFFFLALTGILLLMRYSLRLPPSSIKHLTVSHYYAGLAYFFAPAATMLIGDWRIAWNYLGEALRWTKHDLLWMLGPLGRRLFPRSRVMVGRFNAGQRINMDFQILGKFILFGTGVAMNVFHGAILLYALHLLFSFVLCFMVAGHIYMAVLHPKTRAALSSMFTGYVDANWVERHHPGWFEQLARAQRIARNGAAHQKESPSLEGKS